MSPLENFGVAIANASYDWTPPMRATWDAAKNEEERTEAEIQMLRGLLRECADLSENWPNIAHTKDLTERIEAALTPNVNVTGAARLYRAASVLTAGLGPKRYEGKKPPTRPERHQAKLRRTTKPPAYNDARKNRTKPPAMSQAHSALCLFPRMGDDGGVPWVLRPQAPAND